MHLDIYRKDFCHRRRRPLRPGALLDARTLRRALAWGIGLALAGARALLADAQAEGTRQPVGGDHHRAGAGTPGPLVSLGVAFANQFADLVMRLQLLQLRFDDSLLRNWSTTRSSAA